MYVTCLHVWNCEKVQNLSPCLGPGVRWALYIAPGHGHTTTWYKFWQHFKALIISIILYQFQKDPFCLRLLYMFFFFKFYFIHVYIAQGKAETTLGDNLFMETERSYHFDYWLHVSKSIFALWFYAHFFMILYMYIAQVQGQTTPWGRNVDVNRNILSLRSSVASL